MQELATSLNKREDSGYVFCHERLLTYEQLAKLFQCSTRHLKNLTAQGIIPKRHIGPGMVRFDLKEVKQALLQYQP